MLVINHVTNKAESVGLKLVPTLGRTYNLVLPLKIFKISDAVFKGSLYECNWLINRMIEKSKQ